MDIESINKLTASIKLVSEVKDKYYEEYAADMVHTYTRRAVESIEDAIRALAEEKAPDEQG